MKVTNFTQQVPARFEMPHSKILTEEYLDRCFSSVKKCVDDIMEGKIDKKLSYFPGLETIIKEGNYNDALVNTKMKNANNIYRLQDAQKEKKNQYLGYLSRLGDDKLKEKIKNGIGDFDNLLRGKNENHTWRNSLKIIDIDGHKIKLSEIFNIVENKINKKNIEHHRILHDDSGILIKTGIVAYYIYGTEFIYEKLDKTDEKNETDLLEELGNLEKEELHNRLKEKIVDMDVFIKEMAIIKGKHRTKNVINWKEQKQFIGYDEINLQIKSLYKIISKYVDEKKLFDEKYFVLRKGKILHKAAVIALFIFGKQEVIKNIKILKDQREKDNEFSLEIDKKQITLFKIHIEDYKDLIDENGNFITLDQLFLKHGILLQNEFDTNHANYYKKRLNGLIGQYEKTFYKTIFIKSKGIEGKSKDVIGQRIMKKFVFESFGKEAENYYKNFQEKRRLFREVSNDKFDFNDKRKLRQIFALKELIGDGGGKDLAHKEISIPGKKLTYSKIWFNIRKNNKLEDKGFKNFGYESTKWLAIYLYGKRAEKIIKKFSRKKRIKYYELQKKEKEQQQIEHQWQQSTYEEPEKIDPKKEITDSLTPEQLSFIKTDLDDLEKDWIVEYRNLSIGKIEFIFNFIQKFDDLEFVDFEIVDLKAFQEKSNDLIRKYINENF